MARDVQMQQGGNVLPARSSDQMSSLRPLTAEAPKPVATRLTLPKATWDPAPRPAAEGEPVSVPLSLRARRR